VLLTCHFSAIDLFRVGRTVFEQFGIDEQVIDNDICALQAFKPFEGD
jgi:hypothetical protein